MTIGFCVRKRQRRVEQSTIDAFRELPVARGCGRSTTPGAFWQDRP